jgi:hypothetical protein
MKDRLISFETAKLAKEKGFNRHYSMNYKIYNREGKIEDKVIDLPKTYLKRPLYLGGLACFAPTQSLLQKWFREAHKMFANADISPGSGNYEWFIHNILDHDQEREDFGPLVRESDGHDYLTYEEALEAVLVEALKLI